MRGLRASRHLARSGAALGLALAFAAASPGFAEGDAAAPTRDPSVSTSPTQAVRPGSPGIGAPGHASQDAPPLTRAAVRKRIDEMSPARWLARFGSVSVDRRIDRRE